MSRTSKKKLGFTLIEVLVAIIVSSILISITVSVYNLFRKSMILDQSKADIAQNGRISLDRLTRELRQTPDVVTTLPNDVNDVSVAQPGQIEFQDGHANDLTYRRYYVSGSTLKVDTKEYYFSGNSGVRVPWNASGGQGTLTAHVISTQDIADSIQNISFYGSNQVQIIMNTIGESNQVYPLRTVVYGRNL
jgi:prepilin-type N-terminal cleavage/methylation domain-containing protein